MKIPKLKFEIANFTNQNNFFLNRKVIEKMSNIEKPKESQENMGENVKKF